MIKELIKPLLEEAYNKGHEAGYTKRECEDHEAQNRRLEDMLKYGKEIGRNEGFNDGFAKGYYAGYKEGEMDAKAEIGAIDLDNLDLDKKLVEDDGLANDIH